jgi:hypothetical protein
MQDKNFDFKEYEKAVKSKPDYILDQCYDMIMHISEDSIISLYTCFDNFLFQDIDYGNVISIIPKWVADTGISPESACDKDSFEKLKSTFSHPYLIRFIYYYDVWSLIAALQDRLQAVEYFMQDFYSSIPCFLKYDKKKYTSCIRVGGISSTNAFVSLNSIFVSLASVFDLLSKIAVEQYKFGQYDFSKYKKMKSEGVLYNHTCNDINPSLKGKGLLFSAPLCVRKILTIRNEYIHNGPWDLRCSIYETYIEDNPADIIVYSPDMDEYGNFITSGSRDKFYSQGNMINIQLPHMIMDTLSVIQATIDKIVELYSQDTLRSEDKELTKECIDELTKYYESINNENSQLFTSKK